MENVKRKTGEEEGQMEGEGRRWVGMGRETEKRGAR